MMPQPVLEAKEKLAESEYFLSALRQTSERPREFNYNFSAFLGAIHSVMEVMLYDFVERFRLGFTRKDRLLERDFWVASRALDNAEALRFYEWRNNKISSLAG